MAKVTLGSENKMFVVKVEGAEPKRIKSKQTVLEILKENGIEGILADNMISKAMPGPKPSRTTHIKQIKTCHRPPKTRRHQNHNQMRA
jgi:hypothetical protein